MYQEIRTTCPYDCPDSCGMIAVTDGQQLIRVSGDKEHARTQGFVCQKMQHYENMVHHKERILFPMKRTGAKGEASFERITWEEAADIICEKWNKLSEEYGSECILPYSYAGVEGNVQRHCGEAFFHRLGASRLKRTICASGKGAGWSAAMGNNLGMDAINLKDSDFIIIWSSNMAATRLHEVPYVKEAKNKGAKIVLLETYETPTAAYCTNQVLVRPGSDGALALAMIHVIEKEGLLNQEFLAQCTQGFEQFMKELPNYTPKWAEKITGVSEQTITALAIEYAKANQPSIVLGSGMSRYGNGAMNVRCICALSAAVGAWWKNGGISGCSMADKWIDDSKVRRPDFDKKGTRIINMCQLGGALAGRKPDGSDMNVPVKSLYVYAANPANVTANQKEITECLADEALFTVVHERFMTDTARYADIILPATFSTEQFDIYTPYGYNGVQYSKKVHEPAGECKSDWDTFCYLAKKMGFEESYFTRTEESFCEQLLKDAYGQKAELTKEELESLLDGKSIVKALASCKREEKLKDKILFLNDSVSPALIGYSLSHGMTDELENDKPTLRLVAAPSMYSLNSTFTSQEDLMNKRGCMKLLMNTEDAKERNIQGGDKVSCSNDMGEAVFIAEATDKVKKGTIVAEGIFTKAQSVNGFTVNALFSERLSDLGEATTMNDNLAEVTLVP